MTLFNVPFLPDEQYVEFLVEHVEVLAAVHFPLHPESPFDARHTAGDWDVAELSTHLTPLKGPARYVLLNARVASSSCYRDTMELRQLAGRLDDLLAVGQLDGVVIADFFLLEAIGRYAPEIAAGLEAVPSVNCLLSSFDRVQAVVETIADSGFRLPGRIPLAPALNRQPRLLRETVVACRQAFPDIRIELLVNEGCLYQCPFKLSHDAGIAVNCQGKASWDLPEALGCIAALRANPARLFKSPFIRPEDLGHYRQTADLFKICGRTLGPAFLRQTVGSYINGRHEGNLLDLLDAIEWLSRELFIDNSLLPADFLDTVVACDKQCAACGICENLLRDSRRPHSPRLPDLRKA